MTKRRSEAPPVDADRIGRSPAAPAGLDIDLAESLRQASVDVVPVIADRRSSRVNPTELTARKLSSSAFALFGQRGFDHVTVADIAAEAGVTPRTFYRYFPNKETLLLDISDQNNDRLVRLIATVSPGAPPRQVIEEALVTWFSELEGVLTALVRLVEVSESMHSMQVMHSVRWERRLAEAIQARYADDMTHDDSLIWAALMFALMRVVGTGPGTSSLAERARHFSQRFEALMG